MLVSTKEQDLDALCVELFALEARLIDREFCLASLRSQLFAFESLYVREVGCLYAGLDELNAKIAELTAQIAPTQDARSNAQRARKAAEESKAVSESVLDALQPERPTPELRTLYRSIAKRIHPDLAQGEDDRHKRTQLMSRANIAFEQGDLDALARILIEYERDSMPDSDSAREWQSDSLSMQIDRLNERLTQIESEIVSLSESDLARLMTRVESQRTAQFDPLAHMASIARGEVLRAQQEYVTLKRKTNAV